MKTIAGAYDRLESASPVRDVQVICIIKESENVSTLSVQILQKNVPQALDAKKIA